MHPAQWAELELELGAASASDDESCGRSSAASEGSGSDASGSGSDADESWDRVSAMKRLFVVGATLAFGLVFVLGCADAMMATGVPPAEQSSLVPPTAQTLLIDKPAKRPQSEARETLTILGDGVPTKADAFASPDAPKPLPVAQLAVNKRRRPSSLKPTEKLHDGNVCDQTEELYAGLCYTKCSILTGFPHAHRSTAFSCCPTSDCHLNVFKMKTASLLPCEGYDVSSSDAGKACPHLRGECLEDEEQFMGECFEKCSVLTNGKFPQRIGAASCCDPQGAGGCWNFSNDDTDGKLNVGGGKGDGDASTPQASHFPLKYLTEKQ